MSIKKTLKDVIRHLKGDKKQWKKQEKTARHEAKSDNHLITKLNNDAMKFLDKERRAFNKIAYHEGKRKHKKSRKKGSRRKLHKVV